MSPILIKGDHMFKVRLGIPRRLGALVVFLLVSSSWANAANIESSLQSLVNSVLTRIFPSFALYYVGHTAILYIQDKPEARDRAGKVALGVIALLGVTGVWSWLQGNVR